MSDYKDESIVFDLELVKRNGIENSKGLKFLSFKKSLKPKFGLVWRDIILGYIALGLLSYFLFYAQKNLADWAALYIPLVALALGYFIAYLNLFMHEASHFNIHPNRDTNDLLANWLICSLSGQYMANYRIVHWNHHKHLGTTKDTEHSYFEALNWKFLFESMFGIKAIKTIFGREAEEENQNQNFNKKKFFQFLLIGIVINTCAVLIPLYFGFWHFSLAWVIAMLITFPFFGALRQLLEHRDELANNKIDFSKTDHGRLSRMFRGPFARTMGGAGFNRHLLHHWEPNVSYTRLKELEEYLKDTQVGWVIEKNYSSYFRTFIRLFNS